MGKWGWYAYCGSRFLQEGSCDLPGVVLTPEKAPAGDIAGVVLRQQGALRGQACHLNGVTQLHRLRQLDEGNVVAGIQSEGLSGQEVLAPQPMLTGLGCELRVRPRVTRGPLETS